MTLTDFRTLGRSGLVVSPLALGTMTFGTPRWGVPDETAKNIFDTYVAAGGNFIDTADIYAGGHSEELLGRYIADGQLRDQLVLATKFTWNAEAGRTQAGNPNAGGNGRKNIYRGLDGSLRRLKTDYIDLYWLHAWDMVTPVEEVLQTFGDLVRVGKIRYFGFSDVPAWYATKAATLARVHAIPGPIALQLEYSLVERSIEREHLPAARELGLGVTPWSPLAGGFLAGKYGREDTRKEGRLSGSNPFGDSKFTDQNWRILDILRTIATQIDRPLAQVALAWALGQAGVTALLLGASRVDQLQSNLASLDIRLTAEQQLALDQVSALEPVHPYLMFNPDVQKSMFGGNTVQGWP